MHEHLTPANNEHLRERQNMRDAAEHQANSGNWAVKATLPRGREVIAASGYDTEADAEQAAQNLKTSEHAGYQNSDLEAIHRN